MTQLGLSVPFSEEAVAIYTSFAQDYALMNGEHI